MAFLKKMLLPFAGLVCLCVVAASAADVASDIPDAAADWANELIPEPTESQQGKPEDSQTLPNNETSMKALLGVDARALDRILKLVMKEISRMYGVPEAELARIAEMDGALLLQTLSQLAGPPGQNNDGAALQHLLEKLGTAGVQDEDI